MSSKKHNKKSSKIKKIFNKFKKTKTAKSLGTLLLIFVITGFICTAAFITYLIRTIDPKLDIQLSDVQLNYTSIVYVTDKETGRPVENERLYKDENRIWVNYEDIPENLKKAFIAIEDKRFEKHHGVDWKRTFGALFSFMTGGRTYGGSTITQQLIKNITGEDEVTPQRKIEEIFRALNLEKEYKKDQILEVYLNTIHFGRGLNGVQTAANTYFGKNVSELSLAECASLAGITNWPTKYDPYTKPENNKKRQEYCLSEMYKQGKITKEEYDKAVKEELKFKPLVSKTKKSKQSYFVDQIIEDVIKDLQIEKGYSREYVTQLLYSGGLKIYSTMDTDVQKAMDEVFQDEAHFPKVRGKSKPEAAMVVTDPYTGAVLGMVGGRGEKTADRILNRATQTKRQPGSSIKPIAVYAPAIEYDCITAASPAVDKPDSKGWPKNYYDGYKGQTSILQAVQQSMNTVPVEILKKLKPSRAFDFVTNNLGITSLYANKKIGGKNFSDVNSAALALGACTEGISVLEMTSAFAAFPNNGVYKKPYTYTKVVDSNGKTIIEKRMESKTAMGEDTAFIITKMLESAVQVGTGTPARLGFMPAAGKTGSTSDNKDRWFVGYTPYYAGGVWFGYDTPKEINAIGANPSAVLWRRVMEKINKNKPIKRFKQPDNVTSATICFYNKTIAGDKCPLKETVYFKSGTEPNDVCNGVHQILGEQAEPTNDIKDPITSTQEKPKEPIKPDKPNEPITTTPDTTGEIVTSEKNDNKNNGN